MKTKTGLLLMGICIASALYGQTLTTVAPRIRFKKTMHDFGTIVQGELVGHEFRFQNRGNADLVINGAPLASGRVVLPQEPVRPRKWGTLAVIFDTTERHPGPFVITVMVTSNAQNSPTKLTLQGTVIKK